jgi:hypothetical protein
MYAHLLITKKVTMFWISSHIRKNDGLSLIIHELILRP